MVWWIVGGIVVLVLLVVVLSTMVLSGRISEWEERERGIRRS